MSKPLKDYQVLTFDVYGTLIDWETGIFQGLAPLIQRCKTELSRDQVLEAHAFHESTIQALTPAKLYSSVLAGVYKRLAEEWAVPISWGEAVTYGHSVKNWPAFPDSAEALAYLKQHCRLVVMSNVDNTSFSHSDAKLGRPFAATITAEDSGQYKPALAHFDVLDGLLGRWGLGRSDVLHVAESMFHDHGPANKRKLDNCWIYRRHDKEGFGATMDPGKMPKVAMQYTSMAEFAEAHRSES